MKNMKKLVSLTMLVCLAIATSPTFAGIASTDGAIIEVSPPTSVKAGETQSDTQIIVFAEQYKVLPLDLKVDILDPGTYTGPDATLSEGIITAGTLVCSHMLHFDPVTGNTSLSGSVTFEEPILGLIVLNETGYETLNKSDYLGASGTFYPTNFERRTELKAVNPTDPQDEVIFSADRRTVTVTLLTSVKWQDQVRIITEIEPEQAALEVLEDAMEVIAGLQPESFKNKNFAKTLINKIEATLAMIAEGQYQEAIDKLQNDILKKTDGCEQNDEPDDNDWINNCDDQGKVSELILKAIEMLTLIVT